MIEAFSRPNIAAMTSSPHERFRIFAFSGGSTVIPLHSTPAGRSWPAQPMVIDMISKSFVLSLALLAAVAAAGSASVLTSDPAAAGIGTSPGGRGR